MGMAFAAGWAPCIGPMLATGVLFVMGEWQPLFRPLQRWFAEAGRPPIVVRPVAGRSTRLERLLTEATGGDLDAQAR